MFTAKR